MEYTLCLQGPHLGPWKHREKLRIEPFVFRAPAHDVWICVLKKGRLFVVNLTLEL